MTELDRLHEIADDIDRTAWGRELADALHVIAAHIGEEFDRMSSVRQDIRNLDKRIRQMEFLSRHEIDTLGQLDAYRQTQEQAVAGLLAERHQLHRVGPSDEIKARLDQIAQALKPLRRDIRLCRQIAEQSVQMRERLKQQAEKRPEQNPEQDKTTEREPNREPNQTRWQTIMEECL